MPVCRLGEDRIASQPGRGPSERYGAIYTLTAAVSRLSPSCIPKGDPPPACACKNASVVQRQRAGLCEPELLVSRAQIAAKGQSVHSAPSSDVLE